MNEGCLEWVFDRENAADNERVWNTYGSELAGNFGTKLCGKPVVWGERCEEHKIERRIGKDRRHANDRS
jgi:hypothetical protein